VSAIEHEVLISDALGSLLGIVLLDLRGSGSSQTKTQSDHQNLHSIGFNETMTTHKAQPPLTRVSATSDSD